MESTLAKKPDGKSKRASTTSGAPEAAPALPEALGAHARIPLYLQGAGNAVASPGPGQPTLPVSRPGDPFEREADRAAGHVLEGGVTPLPQKASTPLSARQSANAMPSAGIRGGQPLGTDTRAFMEGRFGQDFAAVRVHTDAKAASSARALDASAYTVGSDVVFDAGQYAPHSARGQRLLAHELTHVVQQSGASPNSITRARANGPMIQRQHGSQGWDPSAPVADFDVAQDTMDPLSQTYVAEPVKVSFPLLPSERRSGRKEDEPQTVYIHSAIISQTPISMFAIPVARVSLTPPAPGAAAAAATEPAPPIPTPATQSQPATSSPPTATPSGGGSAPAPVDQTIVTPAPNPDLPRGTTIYTPDGQSFTVEFSTVEHVVVNRITKYAVGAGACNLVESNGGYFLFDAGANKNVSGPVSVAIADHIAERVGAAPIRGAYPTHAHIDHTSIIEYVMLRVPILQIGVNPLQAQHPTYQAALPRWIAAQQQRRANERTSMFNDAQARAAFESDLRAGLTADQTLDPATVDRLWGVEVDGRMAQMPATQEVMMVQAGRGVLDTLNTRPLDPTTGGREPTEAETGFDDARMIAFGDPALATTTTLRESETDKFSSSYLFSIEDGPTFLVLPDLREPDFKDLRTNFTNAVKELGVRSKFQIWDVTHHMQVGWTGKPTGSVTQHGQRVTGGSQNVRGSVVRATALQNLLQILHDNRAPSGPDGQRGADAVMTSVDANKVETGTINLLKALGFEVYLNTAPTQASGGQDAAATNVLDILTATNRRVTGIHGAPQGRPGAAATLERSHLARDRMNADARLLRQRTARTTDSAEKARLQAQETGIQNQITELRQLELAYIQAVDAASPRPGLNQPVQEPGLAQRQAMDAWFARNDVPPLVTYDMHLTDAALILIRRDPGAEPPAGTPEAARRASGRAIAEIQSRINSRVRALNSGMIEAIGASPAAEQLRLYSDLEELNSRLTQEIDATAPGTSRHILEDLRTHTQEQIRLYMPPETPSTPSRLPTGELVETRVAPVRQPSETPGEGRTPSPTARKLLQANELLGRGMATVMVVTSIRGEASLIERYENAQASGGELAVGTARNVGSLAVGIRMVRGLKVGSGVFVVLSLLDVAEAMLRPSESEREHNTEVAYAEINAAMSIACMYAGEALMATLNPVGIVAGVAVMFLGPRLLELFGLHNWLERKMSFLPAEVTGLHQDLRDELAQYRITVGNLELERRGALEMRDVGATQAGTLQQEARQREQEHRTRATGMEPSILDKFESAYGEARDSYAGLRELDAWRREFFTLQARANPDGPDIVTINPPQAYDAPGGGTGAGASAPPEPTEISAQERALARFRQIDATLTLDDMSVEDIHGMKQWTKIRNGCADVAMRLPTNGGEGDWKPIREKQREMQSLLDNAHYRLDPASMGDYRSTPLLKPGTPARAAYEEEMADADRRVALTQSMIMEAAAGTLRQGPEVGYPSIRVWGDEAHTFTDARLLAMAEAGLSTYKTRLDSMPALPEQFINPVAPHASPGTAAPGAAVGTGTPAATAAADPIYRDSGVVGVVYAEYIRTNEAYRTQITRLQVLEEALTAQIEQARRVIDPPGHYGPDTEEQVGQKARLRNLSAQFSVAQKDRINRRGLLFPEEAQQRQVVQRRGEVDFYARALGDREGAQSLSAEELEALRTGEHGAPNTHLRGTAANRLAAIPDLRRPDAEGRLTGIMRLDQTGTGPFKLVGILKMPKAVPIRTSGDSLASVAEAQVNALNSAAIQALGGTGTHLVDVRRLSTAMQDDLTP